MKMISWMIALSFLMPVAAHAAIKTQKVEYHQGEQLLEGFLAYDDSVHGQVPGVVVVHDWMGLNDYARSRAKQLAKMGYVAFAADIYGKGIRPKDSKEASQLATRYEKDRPLLRERVRAAFNTLLKQPHVDASRVFTIGFCFGGLTALELARSGAPVIGTAVFHSLLDTPTPADARNIKGRVLVLNGADDPFVPADARAAFEKEMRDAHVDWQLNLYGGAVHAFTVPTAGNDPSKGLAYNPEMSRRAWTAMQLFFKDTLASSRK
jgi:dienelactone hydrolase